jgi:SpoVK/Ycf46/Vps4 family AAA+-type ATPase
MKNRPYKGRHGRRAPSVSAIPKAYSPILRLWILRLIHLGGGLFGDRRNRSDISPDAIEAAGLPRIHSRMRESDPTQVAAVEAVFRAALQAAEEGAPTLPQTTPIAQNIEWLGEAAGLNAVERTLLHFVVLGFHHPGLENALDQMGGLSLGSLQALFTRVLGLKASAVGKALDPAGALTRTGLMWVDTSANFPFRGKLEILGGLCDRITSRHRDSWSLFRTAFVKAPESRLTLAHYPHLNKDLEILTPYLKEALRARRKGVNVLIHGGPGTGKTELVRTLSDHLGADLYEVASEDARGGPVCGDDRFRGYRLAQTVLAQKSNHLIFFDEIEDVFRPKDDSPRSSRSNVSGVKAWVNKTLEENPVPAFWVTNHLFIVDDAFVRRFDYVVHLDNPPRSVRRRMLEENLADLPVDEACKDRMADHEGLSPALINRAAGVARAVHPALGEGKVGPVVSHLLGNALEALGHSRNPRQTVEVVTDYRPELVNTDCELSPVLGGLREHGAGRLCFYGPPGTGKTAYGRHLAEQLDRPLLVKRGSDLLSMWVGGTEKLVAAMFEEARAEKAVLLLDEADGFLQERGSAQRNFEVTQVNEMLTQLEAFEGIFIASTNLMDRLDAAALRRFDLKVRFDYLRSEQAWVMFQDAARRLGIEPEAAVKGGLSNLGILTPGDFATVLRQARMNRPKHSRDLLDRLEAECRVKPDSRRKPIGFSERAS